jgi:molybdate transport system substrate-binding protein
MTRMPRGLTAVALLSALAAAKPAVAADLKLLAGLAIEPAMRDLIPQFERAAGHKVSFDLDGAIGTMTERVRKGEAADVLIVSSSQIGMLEQQGKIVAGSRLDIAKVGVGVFVRKGAAKPDIGSVEAFKRAMLAANPLAGTIPLPERPSASTC